MPDTKREIGIIGLGRMGANLSLQAMEKAIRVVGYDLKGVPDELTRAGMVGVESPAGFARELSPPKVIFIYVPAGPVVDRVIEDILPSLDEDDILIDAGNSYWGDSIRRQQRLAEKAIRFIDLGTSGGVEGTRHGACFMAGGERGPLERVEPLLVELAVPGGYAHAGPPGAGHFAKLVHNGIEFGMLQAIAEGVDLLQHYHDRLDIAEVLRCWRNGSVIRSWLIDLMEDAYRAEEGLEEIPSYVEDTGEVNWLVNDALHMEVPVPVISQAVMQLMASRDSDTYWARAVAMMRHGFGGHPYGPSEPVARERREGQVGGFVPLQEQEK